MPSPILSSATANAALYLLTDKEGFIGWDRQYPGAFAWRSLGVSTFLWGLLVTDELVYVGSLYSEDLDADAFSQAKRILVSVDDHHTLFRILASSLSSSSKHADWRRMIDWAGHELLARSEWARAYASINQQDCKGILDQIAGELSVSVEFCKYAGSPFFAHPIELSTMAVLLSVFRDDDWWETVRGPEGLFRDLQMYKHDYNNVKRLIMDDLEAEAPQVQSIQIVDIIPWIMSQVGHQQQLIPMTLSLRNSPGIASLREWLADVLSPSGELITDEDRAKIEEINGQLGSTFGTSTVGEFSLLSHPMTGPAGRPFSALAFQPNPQAYGRELERLYGPSAATIVPYLGMMLS